MLSYNVATLLRSAPGTERRYPVEKLDMEIAEDVRLAAAHRGRGAPFAHRPKHPRACPPDDRNRGLLQPLPPSRLWRRIDVEIDEEALPSIDIDTGQPVNTEDEPDALRLDDHHELDLGEPVREAISLAEPISLLCRPDCRGLCLDMRRRSEHRHRTRTP